jgi:hypothetical protein
VSHIPPITIQRTVEQLDLCDACLMRPVFGLFQLHDDGRPVAA